MIFDEIISDENLKSLNVDMFKNYVFEGVSNELVEQKRQVLLFLPEL